jgi:Protein of unknown function (DUF1573)
MKITSLLCSIALITLVCVFTGNSVKAQDSHPAASGIQFTSTTHDFGKIEQGKPVTVEFEFTNPSMVPLIISNVRPTCGCTIADYPKEPVAPGKSGKIVVTYNAAAIGVFQKTIVVTSNATEGTTNLIIKGEVEAKTQSETK